MAVPLKILFLSAWYPTARDAMAGLFVQKHADAVRAQGVDVQVIYSESKGIAWYQDILRQFKTLQRTWGLPDVVQMNVLDKNGVLALWLKRRYHIPYIIIEHWSAYLPENNTVRTGLHLRMMRYIARHASCILPVSNALEEGMKRHGIRCAHWERIHNVVDDFFYEPFTKEAHTPVRLLHVSCFDERAKNIKGILRAVREVARLRQDFTLTLVGTGTDFAVDKAYADSLEFPDGMIQFTGEVTPIEVCRYMQQSDVFVLFSRYETAGVVLAECLATGLPMIATHAGAMPEIVNAGNGILVPNEDEAALTQAVLNMLNHHQDYSTEVIRAAGQQYTFDAVGKQLIACYTLVLNNERS